MRTGNLQDSVPNTVSKPASEPVVAPLAYLALFSAIPVTIMPFLFFLPLTFGVLALRSISRNPGYAGKERAIFGIIWGVLGAILSVLLLIMIVFQPRHT